MNAIDPPYRLPAGDVEQLDILMWIDAAADHCSWVEVCLDAMFEAQPSEGHRSRLHDELVAMESAGLLGNLLTPNNYGGYYCQLTPSGTNHAELVRQRRADIPLRRKAARDLVLRQLYDVQVGTPSGPALFYGEPFTADELEAARSWLHDRSLITGTVSASGAVFGAEISRAGEDWIDEGRSFAGPTAGHASTSIADDIWRTPGG